MNGLGALSKWAGHKEVFMKNKEVKTLLPLNLQFFAEGGADGAGAGESGDGAGNAGGEGAGDGGSSDNSFDDFLKDPKHQAEFDKRIAKALSTHSEKIQKEIEDKVAAAKTEAERLAKMNADQKAQYEREKKESELAKREAEITKRELTAQAKESLAEKGLPIQLADILNYTDADTCKQSMEAVEKAFTEAVERTVKEKLAGGAPMKKAPTPGGETEEQMIMRLMKGE